MSVQTAHPWADLVRVLLILLPGAAVFGIAAVVLRRYWTVYRTMVRVEGGWLGLLPRHVVLVATSYLTLIGYGIYDTADHFHDPLGGRPFIFGVAFLLGAWAMWDVLGYERARSHRL